MPVFPVFLKLEGRRVLVVGGGPVAAGKLRALLDAGARVTLVAPEVVESSIPRSRREIEIKQRPFEPADLDGVWYVVAAAPPDVNRAVAQAAEARCLFVNAVDDRRERERLCRSDRAASWRHDRPVDRWRGAGARGTACARRSRPCCPTIWMRG